MAELGREKMAEMIALLNADEMTAPAVIGVDIGYFGTSEEDVDQALAEAAGILDNVVMTSYATFGTKIEEQANGSFVTREGVQTYEIPYDALAENVTWGFSNVPLDEDGIVRHSMYKIPMDGDYIYSFASEIYRKYMGELPYRVEYGDATGYIPFTGYPYDYYGTATAGISFSRVLNGEIPAEAFAGTIVLIGPYSAGMMDSYYTAIQHDAAMYGVEVHANILQAFLEENEKYEIGTAASLLITAVMIVIVLLGGRPEKYLWLRSLQLQQSADTGLQREKLMKTAIFFQSCIRSSQQQRYSSVRWASGMSANAERKSRSRPYLEDMYRIMLCPIS